MNSRPCSTVRVSLALAAFLIFSLWSETLWSAKGPSQLHKQQDRRALGGLSIKEQTRVRNLRQVFKEAERKNAYKLALRESRKLGLKALPGLMAISKDRKSKGSTRWIALLEVARLGGKRSAPFLAQFLDEADWTVRSAAIKGLSALRSEKHWRRIAQKLKDPAWMVRIHAAKALEKFRVKESKPYLLRGIQEVARKEGRQEKWLRKHLVSALGALNN